MNAYLAVAAGGALGAVLRYSVGQWVAPVKSGFPFATFGVNLLGSILIGVLYVVIVERSGVNGYWRELLMVGFCGGLTTFSTFSLDAILLWQQGQAQTAILYVVLSMIFCIVAALVAIMLTRMF